jgi:hypothetical protein
LSLRPRLRGKKPGAKPIYNSAALLAPLKRIWFATDQMCSKKLKAAIFLWLPLRAGVWRAACLHHDTLLWRYLGIALPELDTQSAQFAPIARFRLKSGSVRQTQCKTGASAPVLYRT